MSLAPNPPLNPKMTRYYVPANTEVLQAEGALMSAATQASILQTVEEQRTLLINVVSTVRCLKFSAEAGELAGALALVELELERILEGLEGPILKRAAASGSEEAQS